MTQAQSISRNLHFPKKLHTQIKALAQANNLDFAQATMMLLTSGIQDPKLVLPKNRSDQ